MPDVGRSRASPHLLPAPPSTHQPWPRSSRQIQQQLSELGKLGEAERGSRPTLLCPLPHLFSLSVLPWLSCRPSWLQTIWGLEAQRLPTHTS